MKLECGLEENLMLEIVLRSIYPEHFCDIVLEWIEEALQYVFKETDVYNLFKLGRIIRDFNGRIEVKYEEKYFNLNEIISMVIDEMKCALEDEGNESREHIKNELRVLCDDTELYF